MSSLTDTLDRIGLDYKGGTEYQIFSEAILALEVGENLEGLVTDGDLSMLADEALTAIAKNVRKERNRRQREKRCQFVGEFVYRNGNAETAQCTRKPHETGSHAYNGAVIDQ